MKLYTERNVVRIKSSFCNLFFTIVGSKTSGFIHNLLHHTTLPSAVHKYTPITRLIILYMMYIFVCVCVGVCACVCSVYCHEGITKSINMIRRRILTIL